MIVTNLKYALENNLLKKLDLMIDRCERDKPVRDILIICEGAEGEGKTNTSIALAYYVKYKTGRDIHLFFRVKELVNFAKTTYRKIIIWDEPALDSLRKDWYKKANIDLIRLLLMARKRQHFFIFNLTRFWQFDTLFSNERAMALIKMYSRKQKQAGRFLYIRKRDLQKLMDDYNRSKKKNYKKYSSKYVRGQMPEVMLKLMDSMGVIINGKVATYQDYEIEKDKAIESIGEVEEDNEKRYRKKLNDLRYTISTLKYPINDLHDMLKALGITKSGIQRWARREFDADAGGEDINNIGVKGGGDVVGNNG